MLTCGAIRKIYKESGCQMTVQIKGIKVCKSGYLFEISDGNNYCQVYYPSHCPVPRLNSLILIEDFEAVPEVQLIVLSKFKVIMMHSPIGNPQKYEDFLTPSPSPFTPIRSLQTSAFFALKVRLVQKSQININEAKHKITFKSIFIDQNNDTIHALFTNEYVDKFFNFLNEKKVFVISGGLVRKNLISQTAYKINLVIDETSQITEIFDDNSVKQDYYNLVSIKSLAKLNFPTRVDIYGQVISIYKSEFGSVEIQDLSQCSIQLFCGNTEKNLTENSIIICKNVQYEPISNILISDSFSKIQINPTEFPEGKVLKSSVFSQNSKLQKFYTISELLDSAHSSSLPAEVEILGTITSLIISDYKPFWYLACDRENCQKKVSSYSNGLYYCSSCQKFSSKFIHRYCIEICISDCTGKINVKAFDTIGKSILQIPAEALVKLSYFSPESFLKIIHSPPGKQISITLLSKHLSKSSPISKFQWASPQISTSFYLSEISSAIHKKLSI